MNKQPPKNRQRDKAPENERYRVLSGTGGPCEPSSLNIEERSVEVVMSTEDMVSMGGYDEILLMSGATGPEQIPLQDSHRRSSVKNQLGSVRDINVVDNELIGTAFYASDHDSSTAFLKVSEGHAKDYSIGYGIEKETRIEPGQIGVIDGVTYTANETRPLYVVSKWEYRELSQTPIGADPKAKARSKNINPPKEPKMPMNKKVRAYLEGIGLSATASDNEAKRFLLELPEVTRSLAEAEATKEDPARSEPGTTETPVTVEAPREDGAQRVANILTAGRSLSLSNESVAMIESDPNISEADAFRKLHEVFAKRSEETSRPGIVVIADAGDKFRAAAVDGLMLRADLSTNEKEAAPGADSLRGFTLREMARECLRVNNIRIDGNVNEMIGRAMTTDDFSYILSNVANKALGIGWDTAEETWQNCFATGSVNDFKLNTRPRMSEFDDLDEIADGGEYKHGTFSDSQESFQIATFGKLFNITRQCVINDDLSVLTSIPMAMGESAKRKVGDVSWAVFIANAEMGDGTALFHADHGNLAASGAALSVTTLGAGELAMGTQTDQRGLRKLNIRPEYFIAPLALKTSSEQYFQSNMIGTQALPNQTNIYSGNYVNRVYEPRFDAVSATAWYLAGRKGKTVTVYHLNGAERPYMEQKSGWSVDGVEYKVRMDACAKADDWRGVYKNTGA